MESPFFLDWFGDSKVVAADGKPLKVYHGTDAEFGAFDPSRAGKATNHLTARLGIFFDATRSKAEHYARVASNDVPADQVLIEAYLSIQKPYVLSRDAFLAIDSSEAALAVLPGAGYRKRTIRNIEDCDATAIFFFSVPLDGTALTLAQCQRLGEPHQLIDASTVPPAHAGEVLQAFISRYGIGVLKIAGPSEGRTPGSYAYVHNVITSRLTRHSSSPEVGVAPLHLPRPLIGTNLEK